jgi:cell wall-associated NlpC family hydrolase
VRIASYQRGKPYVWGAAGPHAFDCSGLVKYVYGKLGVHLPHHAATQYTRMRHVSHHAERPGDLIFFALAGGGTRSIDHVGIYSGHHRMWVARHPGTTITREYIWTNRYWVGRVR